MLVELAFVFLEDAAILQDLYPEHPCYKLLPLFKDEEWSLFKNVVLLQHDAQAPPEVRPPESMHDKRRFLQDIRQGRS